MVSEVRVFRYDEERIFTELSGNLYGSLFSAIRKLAIQNPYDVDATICRIEISPDRLVISDDGCGMSYDVIKDHFMVIGLSSKERGASSRKGRPTIGSKGIGRLSWQKLGEEAVIETDTGSSAHRILLKRSSMKARIERIPSQGKHGTVWTITGLEPDLVEDRITSYIREKAELLLTRSRDFKVLVNGRRIIPEIAKGGVVRLMTEEYDAMIRLENAPGRIKLNRRGIMIGTADIWGLSGNLDSDMLTETSDREGCVEDRAFEGIVSSLKGEMLESLLRMHRDGSPALGAYRDLLLRICTVNDPRTMAKRHELAHSIPVKVLGAGMVRLQKLADISRGVVETRIRGVMIELSRNGQGTQKGERATGAGYAVIEAMSPSEYALCRILTGATPLENMTESILGSRGVAIPEGEMLPVMNTAERILTVLVGIASEISPPGGPPPFRPLRPGPYRANRLYDVEVRDSVTGRNVGGITLYLCSMDQPDILALADPIGCRIFLNASSPIIHSLKDRSEEFREAILSDEIAHEMAHMIGFGRRVHDDRFTQAHRALKYRYLRRSMFN